MPPPYLVVDYKASSNYEQEDLACKSGLHDMRQQQQQDKVWIYFTRSSLNRVCA